MTKQTPIVLKDSEDIRNIIIQANLKSNTTTVFSSFSAWENLALIMEALGVTAEKCIKEGIEEKHVYQTIKDYLLKTLTGYKLKENQ